MSASLMIVVIGMLAGIWDLGTLVGLFGLVAVMNLSGLLMERRNESTDETDEFGREPLLATKQGRTSKSSIRECAYKWSRPCEVDEGCPYDKSPDECEAANSSKKAAMCPGSRSPGKFRSGYITAKLNAGASYEAVGHRVGATKDVLERHYDPPTKDEERERYQDDIQDHNEDVGGYSND